MFRRRRDWKTLDRARIRSSERLFRRIQESHAPRYLKPELNAAVHGAGVAVHEFAAEQSKLDWASEGQVEVTSS